MDALGIIGLVIGVAGIWLTVISNSTLAAAKRASEAAVEAAEAARESAEAARKSIEETREVAAQAAATARQLSLTVDEARRTDRALGRLVDRIARIVQEKHPDGVQVTGHFNEEGHLDANDVKVALVPAQAVAGVPPVTIDASDPPATEVLTTSDEIHSVVGRREGEPED